MPAHRDFQLDRFQAEAIAAFDSGRSVLVAAPTGSGKTVVAEHAIATTLARGETSFYTSPIKALANQKFRDFSREFGSGNVGLLTGDVSVNGSAPIVVMTTEVLRNMLYERAPRLRTLGCVVLDEVHYLQDRDRGPVWEEVLLQLPADVRTVSLSATVSNLDEFVGWLRSVRGPTELVLEESRPVPLNHTLAVTDRDSRRLHVEPLLRGTKASPQVAQFRTSSKRSGGRRDRTRAKRDRGGRKARTSTPWGPPRRSRLVSELNHRDESPLIWFIFSRAGCDEAVEQLLRSKATFTSHEQAMRLRELLIECTSEIDDDAWASLELDRWQQAFERGITSHHAGLIPAVKEAVERAFLEGLVTVVFATETLALGVNLPARTVVIERLVKYDGHDHKILTPMEFTQLTGRAGRRGLDDEGTAVLCWNTRVGVDDMAELAASREYPLRSAFAPNYNMVANLLRRTDREQARRFVARSFAQYQIDRRSMTDERRALDLESQLATARRAMRCEYGDVEAWASQRNPAAAVADDDELGGLRPGDVIDDRGPALVISVAHRGGGVVVRCIRFDGTEATVRANEIASPIVRLGTTRLPTGSGPNDPELPAWATAELAARWPHEARGVEACPDFGRHRQALGEVAVLERKLARERRRSDRRVGRLERQFDAVVEILQREGFAEGWALTDAGAVLTQVHGRGEAVLAAAVSDGVLDRLEPPELAAALSSLVYEARRGVEVDLGRPGRPVRAALHELSGRALHLRSVEVALLDEHLTAEPDLSFAPVVEGWATGAPLDEILPFGMTGGDFVRSMRQVLDLCRQVSQLDYPVAGVAADAVLCLDHGVVRSRRDILESDRDPDEADADEVDRAD